jgi:hypothetical protein
MEMQPMRLTRSVMIMLTVLQCGCLSSVSFQTEDDLPAMATPELREQRATPGRFARDPDDPLAGGRVDLHERTEAQGTVTEFEN